MTDPFRLTSHADLYRAACGLRDRLGLKGSIHTDCVVDHDYHDYEERYDDKPRIEFSASFFPAPWQPGDDIVRSHIRATAQECFDAFKAAMTERFLTPEPVEAPGLEDCDGHSLMEAAVASD